MTTDDRLLALEHRVADLTLLAVEQTAALANALNALTALASSVFPNRQSEARPTLNS